MAVEMGEEVPSVSVRSALVNLVRSSTHPCYRHISGVLASSRLSAKCLGSLCAGVAVGSKYRPSPHLLNVPSSAAAGGIRHARTGVLCHSLGVRHRASRPRYGNSDVYEGATATRRSVDPKDAVRLRSNPSVKRTHKIGPAISGLLRSLAGPLLCAAYVQR